jgi:HD-GYP domain-containing protein (c-di-GMP phosphodiesterase class II)
MYYKVIPYKLACVNGRSTVDLYFKVKDAYRLFAAEGATFTEDHYRMCNKVTLYIKSEDHVSAEKDMESHIFRVLTDTSVDSEAKADILYSFSMRSLRNVYHATNAKTVEEMNRISRSMVSSILKDPTVVGHVMEMTSIDHYVMQHSVKAATFGLALTINMYTDALDDHDLPGLCTAFMLHDIGMTKVPRNIVDKEEPLTPNEWDVIRNHPLWGHDKLSKTGRLSEGGASIVLYHHERYNGLGYPFRLSGSSIPEYARICAIADTFESLTSKRPFRPTKTPFEALRIMQKEMANEFDPSLFRAFVMLLGPGRKSPVPETGRAADQPALGA